MADRILDFLGAQRVCLCQILAVKLLTLQPFPVYLLILGQLRTYKAIAAIFTGQISQICCISNACIVRYLYIRPGSSQQLLTGTAASFAGDEGLAGAGSGAGIR